MKKKDRDDLLPLTHLARELGDLRSLLSQIVESYSTRLDTEISALVHAIESLDRTEVSASQLRDVRDMLVLLRSLQTKPEKGRRKDLKKIDELIGELETVIERW